MTTVDSPRGLLMICLSFWTGLFTAYFLCAQPSQHRQQSQAQQAQTPGEGLRTASDAARLGRMGRSQARDDGAVVFE